MSSMRMRDAEFIQGRSDLHKIDPRFIKIESGHNPRDYSLAENRQHLDNLKDSISAIGLQFPLVVRWEASTESVYLVDGECRLRAVLELLDEGVEILTVPAIQVPGNNEADRLMLALTANTGKPLTQWEAGSGYKRLAAFGWDARTIATKCNVSVTYVQTALELADAPQAVKQQLSEHKVTPAAARAIVQKHGAEAAEVIEAEVEKAGGKPVKREKATSRSTRAALSVLAAAKKVIAQVTEEEWQSDDRYIEIPRDALDALYIAVKG